MSESKRFEKDYSLDGWPIRDNDNQAVLNTDDLLVILNGFDEMEKSINKLKADAVREAASEILGHPPLNNQYDEFMDYANGIERGEL